MVIGSCKGSTHSNHKVFCNIDYLKIFVSTQQIYSQNFKNSIKLEKKSP